MSIFKLVFVVALVAEMTCAWTAHSSMNPMSTKAKPLQSSCSSNWQNAASRVFCGIALTMGLVFGNPTVGFAQVAPLADVGLRYVILVVSVLFERIHYDDCIAMC